MSSHTDGRPVLFAAHVTRAPELLQLEPRGDVCWVRVCAAARPRAQGRVSVRARGDDGGGRGAGECRGERAGGHAGGRRGEGAGRGPGRGAGGRAEGVLRSTPPRARTRGPRIVDVLVLGPHARRIAPYLYAGRPIVVHGRVQVARWESRAGAEQQVLCMLARRVELRGAPPGARRAAGAVGGGCGGGATGRRGGAMAAVGFSAEMWG